VSKDPTLTNAWYEGGFQMFDLPGDTGIASSLLIQTGKMMATLRPDGTVEFGPDYTPDAAARAFWEGVAEHNPLLPRLAALEAAIAAAIAACDRIDHDISYQTVICALVPVQEWQALTALLDGDA
jgi:hypothetical protein